MRLLRGFTPNLKVYLVLTLIALTPWLINTNKQVENEVYKTDFRESLIVLKLGSSSVYGGDGFDQDVYDWINLKEFWSVKPSAFSFKHVVLVVIDTEAIYVKTWDKIASKYGLYAAKTITVAIVKSDENNPTIVTYETSKTNSRYTYFTGDHVSKIVYMLKSMYPDLPILQIAVIGDYYKSLNKAFNWVNKKQISWRRPFGSGYQDETIESRFYVFSISIDISIADLKYVSDLDKTLSALYNRGSRFFAAAGNINTPIDGKYDENPNWYSWVENSQYMYLVGAIYDFEVEKGYRRGQRTSFSNYNAEGNTRYSRAVKFSMPGYNVETYNKSYVKVNGTSFSAPLAALSYAIALQTIAYFYYDVKGENPLLNINRNSVASIAYEAVIYGSENIAGDVTPMPRADKFTSLIWDRYNGYGCIDVHDSTILAGAASLIDSPEQYIYTRGSSIDLDLRARVLVSKISSIWNPLIKALSNVLGVKYYVYKVTDSGSLRLISIGSLRVGSKDSNSGIIEYRGSLRLERSSSSTETYIVVVKLVAGGSGAHLVFRESDILYQVVFEGNPSTPPLPPF